MLKYFKQSVVRNVQLIIMCFRVLKTVWVDQSPKQWKVFRLYQMVSVCLDRHSVRHIAWYCMWWKAQVFEPSNSWVFELWCFC